MKTNNFFLLHMYLVRKGNYETASWLLKKVIAGNRPRAISYGLWNDHAWRIGGLTDSNGYFIKLTY